MNLPPAPGCEAHHVAQVSIATMFELNATYLIFIVSFLIFIKLLNEIMLKPVGRVLSKRATKIRQDIEDGRTARQQAELVLDAYHDQLAKTKNEAQAVINEAMQKAADQRKAEMARIKEQGRAKLESAKAEIAAERASLIDALVTEEPAFVTDIVSKLLGEQATVSLRTDQVRKALEEAR